MGGRAPGGRTGPCSVSIHAPWRCKRPHCLAKRGNDETPRGVDTCSWILSPAGCSDGGETWHWPRPSNVSSRFATGAPASCHHPPRVTRSRCRLANALNHVTSAECSVRANCSSTLPGNGPGPDRGKAPPASQWSGPCCSRLRRINTRYALKARSREPAMSWGSMNGCLLCSRPRRRRPRGSSGQGSAAATGMLMAAAETSSCRRVMSTRRSQPSEGKVITPDRVRFS